MNLVRGVAYIFCASICISCAQTPTQPYQVWVCVNEDATINKDCLGDQRNAFSGGEQFDDMTRNITMSSDYSEQLNKDVATLNSLSDLDANQRSVGEDALEQFYKYKTGVTAYTLVLNDTARQNNHAKSYQSLMGGYVSGLSAIGVSTKTLSITIGYATGLWGLFGVVYASTWADSRISETESWQSKITPVQNSMDTADAAFRKLELDTSETDAETDYLAWYNKVTAANRQAREFLSLGGLDMQAAAGAVPSSGTITAPKSASAAKPAAAPPKPKPPVAKPRKVPVAVPNAASAAKPAAVPPKPKPPVAKPERVPVAAANAASASRAGSAATEPLPAPAAATR